VTIWGLLGGVGGGDFSLPQYWRLLAVSLFGVTHFGTRASPPFQLFPKGINSFLGTVLESLFAH